MMKFLHKFRYFVLNSQSLLVCPRPLHQRFTEFTELNSVNLRGKGLGYANKICKAPFTLRSIFGTARIKLVPVSLFWFLDYLFLGQKTRAKFLCSNFSVFGDFQSRVLVGSICSLLIEGVVFRND